MNLKNLKKIHFTGIKGVGMTALACCAQDAGIKVSGSDVSEVFVTDKTLEKKGIEWQKGFSENHLPEDLDLLVYTGPFGCNQNPEVQKAKEAGTPTLSHAQALKIFTQEKELVSVAGVGGKSTTSSMLAAMFTHAQKPPSYHVGVGWIPGLGFPGKYLNESSLFICEADEYVACKGLDNTPRFLYQEPEVLIITNISFDHPDVYASLNDTFKAFKDLVDQVKSPGLVLANIDNPNVLSFVKKLDHQVETYGFSDQADWQIKRWQQLPEKQRFSFSYQKVEAEAELQVPGKFNSLNALAAIAAGVYKGLSINQAVAGLKSFKGTQRRFEKIWEGTSLALYDDYAHHPHEIKAVLQASRSWFTNRPITAVFQPHTYSRTQALFSQFAQAFNLADQVVFLPIYASAREKRQKQVSSYRLYQEALKTQTHAYFVQEVKDLKRIFQANLKPNSVVITMGAGDIFLWLPKIKNTLKEIETEK